MLIESDVAAYLVHEDEPIETVLRRITENKSRAVFVVKSNGSLVGALTDGDFRRWLVATDSPSLTDRCSEIANRGCITAPEGASPSTFTRLFGGGVELIPVLDDRRRVIAIARPRTKSFAISGRHITPAEPAFLIAEIGINHNGSLDTAKRLVDAAAVAGADCAKFQMRDMAALYRTSSTGFASEDLGAQYTLDLLAESVLTVDQMIEAFDYARASGLIPLCTPWDIPTVKLLEDYGMPGYKVASADLTNHDLLTQLGATGRPLIVSTGMSTEPEIVESIALLKSLPSPFALLHCNSSYPSPFKDVQLRYMDRLAEIGDCLVGYSGHERGHHIAIAAVARGAKIVEKHITLDRRGRGTDHQVSLEPAEFGQMVVEIRQLEEALGSTQPRVITQGEQLNRLSLAKSIVARTDLPMGHVVDTDDLDIRSPGRGLQPNAKSRLTGLRLTRAVPAGDFFYESDLNPATQPRQFSFTRPWGLPVRFHDYRQLMVKSNPDLLEFHLSYRDMEMDVGQLVPEELDLDLVVHCPELFADDHLLDLATADDDTRKRSITELERVVEITQKLAPKFSRAQRPLIIVNVGGFSPDAAVKASDRPRLYEQVADSLAAVDQTGVEIIIQTMPPYPWLMGGQRFHNLFVDPREAADFSKSHGVRLCLDISHTKLACTLARASFSDAVEILAPRSAHLHLVDAASSDGEGLQVEEGEIDWPILAEQINRLIPTASFIPEIWQGHVGGGEGFWVALDRLESILSPRQTPGG